MVSLSIPNLKFEIVLIGPHVAGESFPPTNRLPGRLARYPSDYIQMFLQTHLDEMVTGIRTTSHKTSTALRARQYPHNKFVSSVPYGENYDGPNYMRPIRCITDPCGLVDQADGHMPL